MPHIRVALLANYQWADFDEIFLCDVSPLTTIPPPSIAVHVVQATRFRLWWLFPTAVICGVTETIGWSGRLWSSQRPYLRLPFLMQYVLVVVPRPHRYGYVDYEVKQDFDDHHGTNIPYCCQLYHLRADHKAARSSILSLKPYTV